LVFFIEFNILIDENIRQTAFESVCSLIKENPEQIENEILLKDIWEGLFFCKEDVREYL
jgi:hypothetical protein